MTADDYEALADAAEELPPGPARLAAWEHAVAAADLANDDEIGYEFRHELMGDALEVGAGQVVAVAFAWCVAKHDADPDRFPAEQVLWRYRWVISELADFPEMPKPQLVQMLADMERRYREYGASLRGYHMLRLNVALELLGGADARESLGAWRKSRRDMFADDPLTEDTFVCRHHLECKRYKLGIRLAETLLARHRPDDFHFPRVNSFLAVPYLMAGRVPDAVAAHRTGIRPAEANPRHVDRLGHHMRFLALTGNFAAGVRLFRTHLANAVGWVDPFSRLQFFDGARLLFALAAEHSGKKLAMRLPADFGFFAESGKYDPGDLAEYLTRESTGIADRFSARSGTTYCQDLIADTDRLPKYAIAHPISGR